MFDKRFREMLMMDYATKNQNTGVLADTNNVSTYNNFYVASLQPISISNITGRNRERYIPDNPDYGLDGSATYHTLKFTLTTVSTATKMCGRIYYKGLLVENE